MFKKTAIGIAAIAAASALILTGCAGDPLDAGDPAPAGDKIVIGSADFPESQLLATIYEQALQAAGIDAETKLNIGSREVYMPAMLDGSINVLPEYSGAALAWFDPEDTSTSPEDVSAALEAALPDEITMLTPSDAQDAGALVVTKAVSDQYGITSIADLAPVAGELVLGGAAEDATRQQGVLGLESLYGVVFKEFKTLDVAGPLTLAALEGGQVQAAFLFSTTPAIQKDNLVLLEDPKSLFSAQNIVPLVANSVNNDTITEVLNKVSAALTTQDVIEMNGRLDDQESVDTVAADWLKDHDLA